MAKKTLTLEDIPGYCLIDGKGYMRVCYKDKYFKKRKKTVRVNTVEEALQARERLRREYVERGPGAWDGDTMLWQNLVAEFRNHDTKTPEWYFKPLDFFNGRRVRSIEYVDCKMFREHRQLIPKRYTESDPRSIASVNRELEILRKVFLFACQNGWLQRNPMRAGKSLILVSQEERRDRVPTPEEEERILAHCVEPRAHIRPLIIATRDTGLRRSALQILTWDMVDWDARLLRVPKAKNEFKRRPKFVGVSDRLFVELRAIFERDNPEPTAKIFGNVKDIKKAYGTACRLAGVSGLRFNDFRHGFATDLMEAGVPQDMAMKAAGHTNADVHNVYVNIDARLALQVTQKLNDLHRSRTAEPAVGSGIRPRIVWEKIPVEEGTLAP